MSVFFIGLLSLFSLTSGDVLDCSSLAGADKQDYAGNDLFVYADNSRACIVEISSGECIALFQGNGKDHSLVSRIFTFDIITGVYNSYWHKVPGDVTLIMATEYDFGEHVNMSTCSIETGSYSMNVTGFLNCSDAREFLVDDYDDHGSFRTTVAMVAIVYFFIALLVSCFCCDRRV